MSYLKILLNGKARAALANMGNSGELYGATWPILSNFIGSAQYIVNSTPHPNS